VRSPWIRAERIIIFAGNLTSLDVSAVNNIDRLNSLISDTESNISNFSTVAALLKQRDSSLSDEQKAKITAQFSSSSFGPVPNTVEDADKIIALEQARLEEYKELLRKALDSEITSPHGYSDTKYLVATAITRLGWS